MLTRAPKMSAVAECVQRGLRAHCVRLELTQDISGWESSDGGEELRPDSFCFDSAFPFPYTSAKEGKVGVS